MQVTLKMVEKMDDLLDETEELLKCANTHSDDSDLKSVYLDLARCHYDGYEKLSQYANRVVERRANGNAEKGQAIREMVDWHKDKFDKRARELKEKMSQVR